MLKDEIGLLSNKEILLTKYGAEIITESDYMSIVEETLSQSKFQYVVFKSFLTENLLLSLRMSTNIIINIIMSDALSSSTQEYLYSKGVVIVGDRLEEPNSKKFTRNWTT